MSEIDQTLKKEESCENDDGKSFAPKTTIEPFRIHSIEPITMSTHKDRCKYVKDANYNLFALRSKDVIIDFLTDSGTGAMSRDQWAAIQHGDESYAGSPSWHIFLEAVQKLFPFKHVLPTHQGRAAEKIIFTIVGGPGKCIANNTHFDTTRANIEFSGARAFDFVIPEGLDPANPHPFKGNMDLIALEAFITEYKPENIPMIMTTITNNSGGGQPVSLENIKATSALCRKYNIPFFIDSCRFAENAWFIKTRESGQSERSIPDIVREIFSYADGMTMSAKKDPLGNIGGWLAMNDDALHEKCNNLLILTEGFSTHVSACVVYGGLAGRDLEALAQGLSECVSHDYLNYRIHQTAYLGNALLAAGIPCVRPIGGHAVYIDARAMLPHIAPLHYPGLTLGVALYEMGGVRTIEIGTVMFGLQPDGITELPAAMDLVRLAIPRRTYTQSHMDYVIEVCIEVFKKGSTLSGYRMTNKPSALRHFTAKFEKL